MTAKAPVFVLGSPRSGTTLLYHMLLSSGDFAIYRAETHVFNLLAPHFGNLAKLENRTRLIDAWLTTDYFRRTGLAAEPLRSRVISECRNYGDFIRVVMESIARQQGIARWAECTPEHLLYIDDIRRTIPDALIIHIVRDGRDVAVSLSKQGWIRPLSIDRDHPLLVAGFYWDWIVQRGRAAGRKIGPAYLEVRFEDLIASPQATLNTIGAFIGKELNYETIQRKGVGSVSEPNSSFLDSGEGTFNPVGRWKNQDPAEMARLEALIGPALRDFGYAMQQPHPRPDLQLRRMRLIYPTMFSGKHWLKSKTFLGRRSDISLLYAPIGEEQASNVHESARP